MRGARVPHREKGACMHYVESPHRLPYEAGSSILQVSVGCTYNRCRFCSLCRKPGKEFRVSPRSEIEEDLSELASYTFRRPRIYLYGGNPFGIDPAELVEVLELIHEKLPEVRSIGGFARVADIAARSDEELRTWARLGVDDVSIGAESGFDPALRYMRKPNTAADLERQCARLDAAGIGYTLFYLAGMAGAGACSQAAAASAEVFRRINPKRINIMTMTVFDDADLAADVAAGDFTPASEHEILAELRDFIAGLEGCTSLVEAGHDTNMVKFDGVLPRDREKMAAYLDSRIACMNERGMSLLRSRMRSL